MNDDAKEGKKSRKRTAHTQNVKDTELIVFLFHLIHPSKPISDLRGMENELFNN